MARAARPAYHPTVPRTAHPDTAPVHRRLFAFAIFASATLLFLVQPLSGKILLPVLGGSPAVWSSCMVFFQAVLLLGYVYAHVLSSRVPAHWQPWVHGSVLLGATLLLPMPIAVGEPGAGDPRWWLLRTLSIRIGLPMFALSATSPLLQQWYYRANATRGGDPYLLYAASNAGSLAGLLGYLAIEVVVTRRVQVTTWAVAFWAVAALIGTCAYVGTRRSATPRPTPAAAAVVRWSDRAAWTALATVPSALLLGVTQHLATDIASMPLLWVAPLTLYLVTLIAAFATRRVGSARGWGRLTPFAALIVLVLSLTETRDPILPITLIHLAAFTMLAMQCHTRLAEKRPDPAHLTGYYLCVSLGGVLGGLAAALVAPAVFSSILEYPLAIAAALALRPQAVDGDHVPAAGYDRRLRRTVAVILLVVGYWSVATFDHATSSKPLPPSLSAWVRPLAGNEEAAQRTVRGLFAIPAALLLISSRGALPFAGATAGLLVAAAVVRTGGDVLHRERTFFGVHQVTSAQNGAWHVLTHGTTTHGVQAVQGRLRPLPTAYYHPTGPIGDVVFTLASAGRLHRVAAVGLGAGALAAYAGPHVTIDFFEIDEAVIRIAENPKYFTYLTDASARPGTTVRTIAVDGRVGLAAAPAASYDLIVMDAFSSDAIPTHLLTREAVTVYESRLAPGGLLAFHVSNRFFDLPPVLATLAADRQLLAYVRRDSEVPPERADEGMRASVWVVLGRREADYGQLARSAPRWVRLLPDAGGPLWTDDYANLLGVLQR